MVTYAHRWGIRGDATLALGIAVLLGFFWALRDWADLSVLHLPDTDDAARLQQIRDWLAGQSFADLSQHRIVGQDGAGLAMHWSRLPDLVPGGIIVLLTPLVGARAAEIAAVVTWPILLFAGVLYLVARITRSLAPGAAPTAIIVAAIGYPVTTLFAPGRIDHHGLQIVLLLVVVRLLAGPRRARAGAIAGVVTVASIAIGMEAAPFLLIAAFWLWADWLRRADGADAVLRSYGGATVAAALLARFVLASNSFEIAACDGFNRPVWLATLAGGGAALMLGVAGRSLAYRPARLGVSIAAAAGTALLIRPVAGMCLHPYGAVDPLVAARWLDRVGEAQSLFAAPLPTAFAYAGLLVVGIVAGIGQMATANRRGWAILLSFQVGALALACFELRGVYAGAVIAAPALAAAIGAARRRGSLPLAAAWIGSAGMVYPIAAQALPATRTHAGASIDPGVGRGCTDRATLAGLARLPAGTLLAPIDLGAYALAETPHRVIAAPYHRNNAGNAALYRFFDASPDDALQIARAWRVDYIAVCDPLPSGRFAGRLRRGNVPAGLEVVAPLVWKIR